MLPRKFWIFASIFSVLTMVSILSLVLNNEENKMMVYGKDNIRAPEFPAGLQWLNTGQPLTLKELRGKVVLLDFWTYCCINCMHVLPKLKKLEHKYGDALVVIGVHSAKFANEGETENIRQAILRYEIEHPVVNDRDFRVWRTYSANAWPTMALIDPQGYIVSQQSGEGAPEAFDPIIAKMIAEFEKKGILDRQPLNLVRESEGIKESILSFPGKVSLSSEGDTLFITDSNHNRILIVSLPDGKVLNVIGSGDSGFKDGAFDNAQFNHPQGTALVGNTLYIADTENHSLRAADLKKREVKTIAGIGHQARRYTRGGDDPLSVPLNSPWDLAVLKEKLYIAMAGFHQIWSLDLKSGRIAVHAGSGYENIQDGALKSAALAQPSGLTTDGEGLYFADSEVSAIRWADTRPDGLVVSIVGEGLFEFGDIDGKGNRVRLQHPLGVAYHEGLLYIADTYNNKIKVINPKQRTSMTLAGTGKEGIEDGGFTQAAFNEPAGIAAAPNGLIYVADTNNHLIRIVDLNSKTVRTLNLKGLDKPAAAPAESPDDYVRLDRKKAAGGKGGIMLTVHLDDGYKITPGTRMSVEIKNSNPYAAKLKETIFQSNDLSINIPVEWLAGETEFAIELSLNYCQTENEGLCYFENRRWILPVEAGNAGAATTVSIAHNVHN